MLHRTDENIRVRTIVFLLLGGACVAFLNVIIAWHNHQWSRLAISFLAGTNLLVFAKILRETRWPNLAICTVFATSQLACLLSFVLSGNSFPLHVSFFIPIGVSLLTHPKTAVVFCALSLLVNFAADICISQRWMAPWNPQGEFRTHVFEVTIYFVAALLCGCSILRESLIGQAESKRQQAKSALQKQLLGLKILADITSELLTAAPSDERWAELLTGVARHLDCDVFMIYEAEFGQLRLRASSALPELVLEEYKLIHFGEKIVGKCAKTHARQYLNVHELQSDAEGAKLYSWGVRAIVALPLMVGETLVGTLCFASKVNDSFEPEELDFITTVGQSIASVRGRTIAESQNRISDLRFRTIVDCAADAFFLVSRDLRIVDVNRQACIALGYTRDELLAMRLPEVASRSDSSFSPLQDRAIVHDVVVETGMHRRKDGTEYQVELHLSPVSLDGADYMIVLTHDTSERQQIAERMIQSQKMESIGRLAGGVAHDFNNLLCVINNYAELLIEDKSLSEEHRSWMHAALEAGKRGAGLARQLLVFGRKAKFAPKAIDLNDVARDSKRLLERVIGENIELVCQICNAPCIVLADRSQLDQVLINLAVNARDAMPKGGKLTIETQVILASDDANNPPQNFVQLQVTDTGVGIAKELLSKVFDPFFTTKEVGQGTGLGLAVVYGIVKETGGTIDVASELGKGTRFQIKLPIHQFVQPSAEILPKPVLYQHNDTILLVEDEPEVRKVTELLLMHRGYTVLVAQSSSHAIELAAMHAKVLSAVVTDIVMPEQSGPEVVREIRKFVPNLPALYISGYSHDTIAELANENEYKNVLRKPFSNEQLAQRLQDTIQRFCRSKQF